MVFAAKQIQNRIVYLPKTITNVILIVLTLALGMSPLELARLQSSPSSAIFRRLASVRGTEISSINIGVGQVVIVVMSGCPGVHMGGPVFI